MQCRPNFPAALGLAAANRRREHEQYRGGNCSFAPQPLGKGKGVESGRQGVDNE